MSQDRSGFVRHVLSNCENDSDEHTFTRVEHPNEEKGTRGKRIPYRHYKDLGIWIPEGLEQLTEYVKDYTTKIAGKTYTGILGLAMRGVIHQSETIWAGFKSEMDDGDTFHDMENIWETCEGWVPNQGNGRGRGKVTVSKSDMEDLTKEEILAALDAKGLLK